MCHARAAKKKRNGQIVAVTEYYHKDVVAQWVGAHPPIVLDFESMNPGEGEQPAAYRLIQRLEATYGQAIGTLLADAGYDGAPCRRQCGRAGYRFVIRHKNDNIDPGRSLARRLEQRDPARMHPDSIYRETDSRRRYECWAEKEIADGLRLVEARRTDPNGQVPTGACLTDIPASQAPPVAVAMLMETRWWIENTRFHELAGRWNLDRAYVHAGRHTAARAVATLAFMAYNTLLTYVYRELGLDPARPVRTIDSFKSDLRETLALFPRGRLSALGP